MSRTLLPVAQTHRILSRNGCDMAFIARGLLDMFLLPISNARKAASSPIFLRVKPFITKNRIK